MNDATSPSPPPRRRLSRTILRVPALVLVALYFLIDDVVLAAFRPVVAWASELRPFLRFAMFLRRLPPYPTLALFLVPFVVLEPMKIGGLWLMATGRFGVGLVTLVVAHVSSIVLVERLFHATRDKLLTIGWFAVGYGWVMRLYDWSLGRLRATEAWRQMEAWLRGARVRFATAVAGLKAGPTAARLRRRIADARVAIGRWRERLRRRA